MPTTQSNCLGAVVIKMNLFVALTLGLAAGVFCPVTCADTLRGWHVGVAVEEYSWKEFISGFPSPKEHGSRRALFLSWNSPKTTAPYFGYIGKVYDGIVDYDTFTTTGIALATTTDYSGMLNEARAVFPSRLMSIVGGLGYEFWSRKMADGATATNLRIPGYAEKYDISFLRLGLSASASESLELSFGFKQAIKNSMTTSLKLGSFHLGTGASPYFDAEYRVTPRVNVAAYYDSWRFGKSQVNADGSYQPRSRMDAIGIRSVWHF